MVLSSYRLDMIVSVPGLFCIFFLSSRRRHTRLQGDWSSDVCSSDLIARTGGRSNQPEANPQPPPRAGTGLFQPSRGAVRPGLRAGPILGSVWALAAASLASPSGGGPGFGRGPAERVAGAPVPESHRGR